MIEVPLELFVVKVTPGDAQMVPAQSRPFIAAAPLIDIVPWGIRTIAAGRLVPPNFRVWVAVLQLVELSPLLATIAMFSALGRLLHGKGLVVIEL